MLFYTELNYLTKWIPKSSFGLVIILYLIKLPLSKIPCSCKTNFLTKSDTKSVTKSDTKSDAKSKRGRNGD